MKVNTKYLIFALLISIIFSISAVAAEENITFEQSDKNSASIETLTAIPDDNQEIKLTKDSLTRAGVIILLLSGLVFHDFFALKYIKSFNEVVIS